MVAKRTSVSEMWYQVTLSKIEEQLQGAPDGDDRQRGLKNVAAWVRSTPSDIKPFVESAVRSAVGAGKVTEEEAEFLLSASNMG